MTPSLTFCVDIIILISPLYNPYIIKVGEIIFFIFISNYLLLYFLNFKIFSFINILLIQIIAAATAITAAAEVIIKIYIILTLIGASFLILFTVLIIF